MRVPQFQIAELKLHCVEKLIVWFQIVSHENCKTVDQITRLNIRFRFLCLLDIFMSVVGTFHTEEFP